MWGLYSWWRIASRLGGGFFVGLGVVRFVALDVNNLGEVRGILSLRAVDHILSLASTALFLVCTISSTTLH
jgi:hypothetical protein